jgi:hypothetical protein
MRRLAKCLHNEQLLLTAYAAEAAGSLRSPAAFFMIARSRTGRYTAITLCLTV